MGKWHWNETPLNYNKNSLTYVKRSLAKSAFVFVNDLDDNCEGKKSIGTAGSELEFWNQKGLWGRKRQIESLEKN